MREFKSLNPQELPDGFELAVHTEEPVVKLQESPGRITITFAFPGFFLVDDSREVAGEKMELKQLNITSTGFLSESGKPMLPTFGRYVQIPRDCDYKVTVEKGQPVTFEGIEVAPAQTEMSDNPNQEHVFEYNKEFYAKDLLYPEDIIKVTGPFSVDQYLALLVHVTPVQYNPAQKKLIGYGDIKVTIELQEKPGAKAGPISHIDHEAFGNLMLNREKGVEARTGQPIPPIVIRAAGPELLIIYAKVFENAAQRLADWKDHRGIISEIACIDTIGNDVKKIKTYIRSKRGKIASLLRYVLLFGDGDMIKTQTDLHSQFGVSYRPDDLTATDYYYSTRYDEHTPDPANPTGRLFYPWLAIGRCPVRPDQEGPPASGDSQAQGIVDQIIAYEKNPPADASFYQRMTFAAFFQGENHRDSRGYLTTIERLRSHIASLGYAAERVYTTNDPNLQYFMDGAVIPPDVKAAVVSSTTATQMLIQAATEGQLYLGHRDHGLWNGWHEPPFSNSDLDMVTGDMPSIFYSINCETGGFDYSAPTECFAEKNLRMKGTAPSLIAATRDSGTFLNNDLIKGLYDATFGGVIPTFPSGSPSYPLKNNRLGDILNYGKSYLPTVNPGNERGIKDHFEIYHVIGDPTLELWKNLPLTITIKAKIIRKNLDIQLSSCPSGAVITIWYGKKMLKRIEPDTTHITIPTTGLIPISPPSPVLRPALVVCFWAPGYRYQEVKVPI